MFILCNIPFTILLMWSTQLLLSALCTTDALPPPPISGCGPPYLFWLGFPEETNTWYLQIYLRTKCLDLGLCRLLIFRCFVPFFSKNGRSVLKCLQSNTKGARPFFKKRIALWFIKTMAEVQFLPFVPYWLCHKWACYNFSIAFAWLCLFTSDK